MPGVDEVSVFFSLVGAKFGPEVIWLVMESEPDGFDCFFFWGGWLDAFKYLEEEGDLD